MGRTIPGDTGVPGMGVTGSGGDCQGGCPWWRGRWPAWVTSGGGMVVWTCALDGEGILRVSTPS